MFFYPLPPFFPLNLSIFLFDSFFFFRVISDEKALSVSIVCYLGQGLELIAFLYVAVNFFISVNFYFSYVINSLAYITIAKNNGKIKIN